MKLNVRMQLRLRSQYALAMLTILAFSSVFQDVWRYSGKIHIRFIRNNRKPLGLFTYLMFKYRYLEHITHTGTVWYSLQQD